MFETAGELFQLFSNASTAECKGGGTFKVQKVNRNWNETNYMFLWGIFHMNKRKTLHKSFQFTSCGGRGLTRGCLQTQIMQWLWQAACQKVENGFV